MTNSLRLLPVLVLSLASSACQVSPAILSQKLEIDLAVTDNGAPVASEDVVFIVKGDGTTLFWRAPTLDASGHYSRHEMPLGVFLAEFKDRLEPINSLNIEVKARGRTATCKLSPGFARLETKELEVFQSIDSYFNRNILALYQGQPARPFAWQHSSHFEDGPLTISGRCEFSSPSPQNAGISYAQIVDLVSRQGSSGRLVSDSSGRGETGEAARDDRAPATTRAAE